MWYDTTRELMEHYFKSWVPKTSRKYQKLCLGHVPDKKLLLIIDGLELSNDILNIILLLKLPNWIVPVYSIRWVFRLISHWSALRCTLIGWIWKLLKSCSWKQNHKRQNQNVQFSESIIFWWHQEKVRKFSVDAWEPYL